MGLGLLSGHMPIKRKTRYVFVAQDENGNKLWEESVKISRYPQPALSAIGDENGGKIVQYPSEFDIAIFKEKSQECELNLSEVKLGQVLCYFGDEIYSKFDLKGVEVVPIPNTYMADDNEIIIECRVNYKTSVYECVEDIWNCGKS